MSEKMTSQNELTEIKSVPYNKPLVLVLLGADQNSSPKLFFLSHEQKHQQKLASPIADENRHKIAFWYNTYIRLKKQQHEKKFR